MTVKIALSIESPALGAGDISGAAIRQALINKIREIDSAQEKIDNRIGYGLIDEWKDSVKIIE